MLSLYPHQFLKSPFFKHSKSFLQDNIKLLIHKKGFFIEIGLEQYIDFQKLSQEYEKLQLPLKINYHLA